MDTRRLNDVIRDLSDKNKITLLINYLNKMQDTSEILKCREVYANVIGMLDTLSKLHSFDKQKEVVLLIYTEISNLFNMLKVQLDINERSKNNKESQIKSLEESIKKKTERGDPIPEATINTLKKLKADVAELDKINNHLRAEIKQIDGIINSVQFLDFSGEAKQEAEKEASQLFPGKLLASEDDYYAKKKKIKGEVYLVENMLISDRFKESLKNFASYQAIQKFIRENPTSERTKYLVNFLNEIEKSNNPKWYSNLEDCFSLLQGHQLPGKKFSPFSEAEKALIRDKYGAIGNIITNSKMDYETFEILNSLMSEINKYQKQFLKIPEIQQDYISKDRKEELRNNTPAQQFQRDTEVWQSYLFQDQSNATFQPGITNQHTDVMKRVFLTLQSSKLGYSNSGDGSYGDLLGANQQLQDDQKMPVASLLSHGGRVVIQIPPLSSPNQDPDQFFKWLIGGGDQVSDQTHGYLADQENKPVYRRPAATHAITMNNGEVVELRLTPLNPIDDVRLARDFFLQRHYGMDLGLKEPGQPGSENGANGHLYMYWMPPTADQPGGLLLGCEGSSPEPGLVSYYGDMHTAAAISNEFSPTGGLKYRDFPDDYQLKPNPVNGLKLSLSTNELNTLTQRTASELTSDQLAKPAGSQLAPLPPKAQIVTPPPRPKQPPSAHAFASNSSSSTLFKRKSGDSTTTDHKSAAKSAPERFKRYFHFTRATTAQRMGNTSAKMFNQLEHIIHDQKAYDEIGNNSGIYLGIIPTVDLLKGIEQKTQKNITVISIVDVFEFASGKVMRPADCEANGWNHYHLPMTDYTQDMESENIIAAAKAIHEAKQRGDAVYIHCKAGKARSAMVLAVYHALYDEDFLSQHKNESPQQLLKSAIEHVKKYRAQVDLHDELIDALGPNAWDKLATDQENLKGQIHEKYNGKKNIGKICTAFNAIEYAQNKMQPPSPDYSYSGEHFLNALTQSFAYKALTIFAWELEKNALLAHKRTGYFNDFLSLLIDDPAKAITQLKNHFENHHPDENNLITKLISNSKADKITPILISLYNGVVSYDMQVKNQNKNPSFESKIPLQTNDKSIALTTSSTTQPQPNPRRPSGSNG